MTSRQIVENLKWRLIGPFVRKFAPCDEAARLISQSLDGILPFKKRILIRLHLLFCKWCSRYKKQLRLLEGAFKSGSSNVELQPDQNLSPEARDRMKQLIRNNP